jgi:hypothetical protein
MDRSFLGVISEAAVKGRGMGDAAPFLQSEREALRSPRTIGERQVLTRNVFGMTQTEFGKGAGIKAR